MTTAAALRGGLLYAAVGAVAWLLAGALAGTVYVVLILATLAVAAWVVIRGDVRPIVWGVLAAAWAVVLLERAIVQENGGLWVAIASFLGVVIGARRAGISKWMTPFLLYPALSVAIVVLAGQDLPSPWGSSWLWLAAVLGPVLGARTLLGEPAEPAAR